MTMSGRHFVLFVSAVVLANVVTVLAVAALYRSAPGLKEHSPGFGG